MTSRWLLIDGHNLIYRAFYGVPATLTRPSDGAIVNAARFRRTLGVVRTSPLSTTVCLADQVLGVSNSMLRIARRPRPLFAGESTRARWGDVRDDVLTCAGATVRAARRESGLRQRPTRQYTIEDSTFGFWERVERRVSGLEGTMESVLESRP